MAEAVPARQTKQRQRADPQRAAARPARQGAMPARAGIDRLQRALGNRGMARLLRSGAIQAKLAVGPADDEYEREADRVADDVMRMPDPRSDVTVQGAPLSAQRVCSECGAEMQRHPAASRRPPAHISRKCAKCEDAEAHAAVQRKSDPTDEKDEEDEGIAQAKSRNVDPPEASSELTSYIAASRGGGLPLPPSIRAHFEDRFGHDFSDVRIHTDTRSADAAVEINSLAFTTGSDIHFGSGRFQPSTPSGDRLLTHELTHTIQQTGGRLQRANLPSAPAKRESQSTTRPQAPPHHLA